jgi:hypothetical protein
MLIYKYFETRNSYTEIIKYIVNIRKYTATQTTSIQSPNGQNIVSETVCLFKTMNIIKNLHLF